MMVTDGLGNGIHNNDTNLNTTHWHVRVLLTMLQLARCSPEIQRVCVNHVGRFTIGSTRVNYLEYRLALAPSHYLYGLINSPHRKFLGVSNYTKGAGLAKEKSNLQVRNPSKP